MRPSFGIAIRAGLAVLFLFAAPAATRAVTPGDAAVAAPDLGEESQPSAQGAAPVIDEKVEATPRAAKPAQSTDRLELTPLGFDLLGAPTLPLAPVNEEKMRWRRRLLQWHQGVGLGVFGLTLATTVVGQLNYSDRFAGGPSTGKYIGAHKALAYTTLIAFTGDGALAIFAPRPFERTGGFDRVDLHKTSMAVATAGMLAQGIVGVMTRQREGYLNQERYARVHLILGYATLAALATGVGALVF